ncbi:hypothetical protein M413DRAFT_22362 [Hebeloma cylindrosporum]|uniref:G-protein coupled receptors family 1 profile domain-containing protein n=1 Tax=Hebeloma cylindrosporum TaxID=76867 RepID=A0A0C3CG71_HEBCY|nr:hypothetical protein M413DRAFT_22362 [Hebeloma cylindrosporum h7]
MVNARIALSLYWTHLDLSYLRPTFLALHLSGGLIGLPLLIITLLFANDTSSQPELVNFCLAWVLNSISYSLSVFKATLDDPHSPLCFAQAAMVQGAPPMTALATFLVVFKIWRTFKNPGQMSGPNHCSESTTQFITISLPYVAFVVFVLISVVLQIKIPQSLTTANGLYCTTSGTPFRRWSVPILSIIMLALMIGFEVAIAIRYYLARRRIVTSFPLARRRTSLGLVIRISLFNVYLFVALGASVVFLTGKLQPWPYMIQAALPLMAFLLFASQKVGPFLLPSHITGD